MQIRGTLSCTSGVCMKHTGHTRRYVKGEVLNWRMNTQTKTNIRRQRALSENNNKRI